MGCTHSAVLQQEKKPRKKETGKEAEIRKKGQQGEEEDLKEKGEEGDSPGTSLSKASPSSPPPAPYCIPFSPDDFYKGEELFLTEESLTEDVVRRQLCIVGRCVNVSDGDSIRIRYDRGREIERGREVDR